MSVITDRLDDVEHRVNTIEVNAAKLDARLEALVSSTNNLKWSIWTITLICLLALVYGAVGRDGFFAVRDAAAGTMQQGGAK